MGFNGPAPEVLRKYQAAHRDGRVECQFRNGSLEWKPWQSKDLPAIAWKFYRFRIAKGDPRRFYL